MLKETNLLDDLKLISRADYSNIIAVASYYAFSGTTIAMNFEHWISTNFMLLSTFWVRRFTKRPLLWGRVVTMGVYFWGYYSTLVKISCFCF
ncbi:MAG: hypothetical protein LBE09_02180 [Christensenellaceae bacterium]|jgi:hypothetical protein|nr:hypothetical protein [Christensenellaceae bacterium]